MNKITQFLLLAVAMVFSTSVIAQSTVSGTIIDSELNAPLPGANIVEKGTSNGASSDFDGNFTLQTDASSGEIVVSYVGYASVTLAFNGDTNLGSISLSPDNALDEVIVTGVVDYARERQTPVAVSTIRATEIQEKLGSQEFPEILSSTPSVYATKQGGGFGDARINIRGFNQRNVAVMINGMPVNDMENGWVYWSNWAGLSDVTSAMQVQRGLGSSKLAISSVGGTINVITNTSDKRQGGSVRFSTGNDNYQKYVASYSTGLLDSGFSASLLFSRTSGDGYIDGTEFEGHNYFIGLGYKVNDNHNLMFTFTGAPQWHNQHSRAVSIENYIKYGGSEDEPNRKYNEQWGYLDGEVFTWRRNFYHKPVMSLNWEWDVSDNSNLSTVLYGSWGRGGGSGPIGQINGGRDYYSQFRDQSTGQIRFDDIYAWNSGQSVSDFGADRETPFINDRYTGFTRRASMNSHNWYGIIANFHNDANENLSWDLGIDARTYKGIHYRTVNNILGASGYLDDRDDNNPNRTIDKFIDVSPDWNPWANITDQQKIEYYNDGGVRWLGAFGQVEYKTEDVSTFVQFGVSNQAFQRIDYFNLPPAEQESDWESLSGFNLKGGLNYNINASHNVFFNTGYYSKQPLFSAVYSSFSNNDVSEGLTNEKILGLELGYGFKNENYRLNLNVYRTSWKDRFLRQSRSGLDGYVDFRGIEQVHTGVELESSAEFGKIRFDGMVSIGNWEYKGNVKGTEVDDLGNIVGDSDRTFYLDGKKVGDAAQFTGRLAVNYQVCDALSFDLSQRYIDKLYAQIDADGFDDEETVSLRLPSYSVIDIGASYTYKFKNDNSSLRLRLNVNNLANQLYISESATNDAASSNPSENWHGVNKDNRVYWGFGRTWNATLSYNF